MSEDAVPAAVRAWIATLGRRGPEVDEARRAVLRDDVRLTFAGSTVQGVDAVLAHQARAPSSLAADPPTWSLRPGATPRELTMRARFPGGADGRTGASGLSALDLGFTLDAAGRIGHLRPVPHHREPPGLRPPLRVGEVAPAFTLPDTDGRPVPLHGARPAVTLVVWTCNHCPWALAWHARLQGVARDHAASVRVLQINGNDPAVSPHDALDACRARVADGAFAGPYLIDAGQAVARAWGVRHTPEAFVLDARGVVAYHGAPDADHARDDLDAGWLRDALHAAAEGRPAEPAETEPVGCTVKWTFPSAAGGAA